MRITAIACILSAYGCQTPGSPSHAASTPIAVCVVADMGTADPVLYKTATDRVNAASGGRDIWSLWAATNGDLVSMDEYYDVLRATDATTFDYRSEQQGQVKTRVSGKLSDATRDAFIAKIEAADKLCDTNTPAFGGTTFHYIHVEKQDDGSLKTFGAFVAKNPGASASGDAYIEIYNLFDSLRTQVN